MSDANVADLVCGMHADELRGVSEVMARYVRLVHKAATGKPLAGDEATVAASCAYELGFPPDRFDRDVATVKAEQTLAAQMEQDEVSKAQTRAVGDQHREKLKALEAEMRATRVAMQRMSGAAMERSARRTQHATLRAANPHLFKPAATLTETEWKAVRT